MKSGKRNYNHKIRNSNNMIERIFIAPVTYLLLTIAGLLLSPYLLSLAWVRIIPLIKESKGLDLALKGAER